MIELGLSMGQFCTQPGTQPMVSLDIDGFVKILLNFNGSGWDRQI